MKPYAHYFLIVLFFFPLWISAQVFPVQANPQVIPPYSLKLSEYGTASSEKLILNLLLTDITEANRQVQLKLFIENNAGLSIRSSDVVMGANPIFLDGGVPLRLSNLDLQPYFSLQNLTGIAPQQYSTPLPEGLYRFCFEVYDALSGQQISRKSCVPVYLVLNDPPFLNLPFRGEQVLMREPQNIVFQWTPRHLNATNVSYEFTLTELWDNQMDPQAAFLAGRPLYQTTTLATTLLYGPGETQLLPDKKYGWRVRAMVSDGISETSVFKNDGYSEIFYFTHTGRCAEPRTIISEATNKTTEKIYWEGVDHLAYDIQYRKKNTGDANQANIWFNEKSLSEYTTIYNLEPGVTYEFRVGGQCMENGPFAYSQISEFTMPIENSDTASYNCGIRPPDIEITNQEPLTSIITNEVFTAGDFPVTVKEITAGNVRYLADERTEEEKERDDEENRGVPVVEESTDGKGIFSGWGYIVVPYLNDTRIKVSFEGIKINTDYQLIEGIVQTDYDKNWGGLTSINDVLDPFEGDNDLRNINLDYDITIDNISIAADGSIVITHPISESTIEYPGGDDIIIMDTNADGTSDIFHVDTDGNIRQGGQLAQGGAINPDNTDGIDSKGDVIELTEKGIKVTFMDASEYAYGFDWIPQGMEQQLGKYYKQIKDVEGNPYNIINKAIGNGKDDIIKAKVAISDNTLSIDDLVIKTEHGENIPYQNLGNGIISVKISGYYTFEYQNIYATIQPKKNKTPKQTVAGVFSLWHLSDKQVNVTIVPVDGAELPSDDVLSAKLNGIFKKASVTFNVTVAPNMGSMKSQVAVGDSGVMSNYTSDMRDIIIQYKKTRSTDPKSYYVFVLGKNTRPSRSVAGFMPLKRQFGFVFSSNLSSAEEGKTSLEGTLAHELGHGVFALEHPFTQLNTTQGKTDWLSDYGNGTKFSHMDWLQMHNPSFKLYWFQDDLDGALNISALTPNGMIMNYTGNGAIIFTDDVPEESNGAVFAILEEGKLYEWKEVSGTANYRAHSYSYNDNKLKSVEIERFSDNVQLQLYWNKGSCDKNEIYQTSSDSVENYLIAEHPSLPKRLTLDLNSRQYEGINLLGIAGCSTDTFCGNVVMKDFEPELQELVRISNAINAKRDVPSATAIAEKVFDLNICGLRTLDYVVVKTLLLRILSQTVFNDNLVSEEAVVKLLLCIPSDNYTDFVNTVVTLRDGQRLDNVIDKMTNDPFPGLSEAGEDNFLTSFSNIVAGSENEEAKWKVFNSVVRAKYESLQEEPIAGLQLGILRSLSWENQEEFNKIPAVFTLFVDMLQDPNISNSLNSYKKIYDIAALRNDHKELFRSFTIADFIVLIKNPNYNYSNMESTQSFPVSTGSYSWLLPLLKGVENEEPLIALQLKEGEYIIEDNYLQNNSAWYRYARTNNFDKNRLDIEPEYFLNTFFEQFSYYLKIGRESNSEFWNRIVTVNCDNINDVVRHINLNENPQSLQAVNQNTRFSFLRTYFNTECRNPLNTEDIDYDSHNLEGTDNSLMKISNSFPTSNKAILRIIESIGLNTIYDKLDTDNFSAFSTWIGMQIMYSGDFIPVDRRFTSFIENSQENRSSLDLDEILQLESNIFSWQNFNSNIIEKTRLRINAVNGSHYDNQILYYNQIVLAHVQSSFSFGGQNFEPGQVIVMPIIQAFALSKKNRAILAGKTAWLTAEVGFFVLGAYQLRVLWKAGSYLRNAALVSDVVGSAAGVLAAALNESAISPELRFRIQMLSLVASAPSLFVGLGSTRLNDQINDAIEEVNVLRSTERLSPSSQRTIVNHLTELGGSGTRVSNIPGGYQAAFRADFGDINAADLGEDFIKAWKNYRDGLNLGTSTSKICN
ncbi:hypothetical protein [Aquimarina celericrescens]|uniref:Fibronectin type-III domain-containing protein n=1 Tax=Aquimarina celericrescens TaxID=1964542 RepID=A0ABW5AS21_9FLAO|nr:hypothetical protein [Aquimarina celericrescens]